MDIAKLTSQLSEAKQSESERLPPVEKWDPPFCGDMNLVIKRSGQWWHEGTPFTRDKLVKLFSTILKREGDDYFLVTPVEKVGIQVEDVPFIVIDDEITDKGIYIITQTGDKVLVGKEHPVELRKFEHTIVPYCNIRRNLWARLHQNVLYRWAEQAVLSSPSNDITSCKAGANELILKSGDYTFSIGRIL